MEPDRVRAKVPDGDRAPTRTAFGWIAPAAPVAPPPALAALPVNDVVTGTPPAARYTLAPLALPLKFASQTLPLGVPLALALVLEVVLLLPATRAE